MNTQNGTAYNKVTTTENDLNAQLIGAGLLLIAGGVICKLLFGDNEPEIKKSPAQLTEREIVEEILREEFRS